MATLRQIMLELHTDMTGGTPEEAVATFNEFTALCPPPPGLDIDAELDVATEEFYREHTKRLIAVYKKVLQSFKRAHSAPFN